MAKVRVGGPFSFRKVEDPFDFRERGWEVLDPFVADGTTMSLPSWLTFMCASGLPCLRKCQCRTVLCPRCGGWIWRSRRRKRPTRRSMPPQGRQGQQAGEGAGHREGPAQAGY